MMPFPPAFLKDPTPRRLEIGCIDGEEDFYRMSFAFDQGPLGASIRLSGLMHPLLVEDAAGTGPIIVSGFRRYVACLGLGMEAVPVLVASGDRQALFEAVLLENLSHRAFNPVEISLAVNRLARWYSPEGIARDFLPLMGMDPSPRLLSQCMAIRNLEEEIREALVKGMLNIGDVPALLKWSGGQREAVFRLFHDLKMGTNIRREIALNLFEIEKRDGIPPRQLLAGDDVAAVLRHPEFSIPQKAQAVRWIIRKRRYPVLTRLEEEFALNVRALRLPANVSMNHPPGFEGEPYHCMFTFRSGREFEQLVDKLHGIRHEKILPEEDHR